MISEWRMGSHSIMEMLDGIRNGGYRIYDSFAYLSGERVCNSGMVTERKDGH